MELKFLNVGNRIKIVKKSEENNEDTFFEKMSQEIKLGRFIENDVDSTNYFGIYLDPEEIVPLFTGLVFHNSWKDDSISDNRKTFKKALFEGYKEYKKIHPLKTNLYEVF